MSIDKYKQIQEERRALQARSEELAKQAFAEASNDVFNAHPALAGFAWEQYTPYFNDGDECVFRACTDYGMDFRLDTGEEDPLELEYFDGVKYCEDEWVKANAETVQAAYDAVQGIFSNFGDDDLKDLLVTT